MHKQSKLVWMVLLLSDMSFGSDQLKCRKQRSPHETCQEILKALLEDEDNKICADCRAKGTQWASWNLGLFLCIRCAGIHRNLGVHISKVKSIYLDSWSQENLYMLQKLGNKKAREIYEANLPNTVYKSEHDPNLESWIRMKYEYKRFMAKDWIPPEYEKEKNLSKKKKSGKHKFKVNGKLNSSILADCRISPTGNGMKPEAKKIEEISSSLRSESLEDLKKKGITLHSSLWQ